MMSKIGTGTPISQRSIEKALVFPGDFIDAIVRFCGLPRSDHLRDGLIRLIEPNQKTYIRHARREYDGIVEGVIGGFLYGWCRLTGIDDPVRLDLLVDDRLRLTFDADLFRQDLFDAGLGGGKHGFSLDLTKLGIGPGQVVRIKVSAHGVELKNSGLPLRALGS